MILYKLGLAIKLAEANFLLAKSTLTILDISVVKYPFPYIYAFRDS